MAHTGASDDRPALQFRIAGQEDAARLIAMINAAFSVEEFLGGTRTDAERLASMMAKGAILMVEDLAGRQSVLEEQIAASARRRSRKRSTAATREPTSDERP